MADNKIDGDYDVAVTITRTQKSSLTAKPLQLTLDQPTQPAPENDAKTHPAPATDLNNNAELPEQSKSDQTPQDQKPEV